MSGSIEASGVVTTLLLLGAGAATFLLVSYICFNWRYWKVQRWARKVNRDRPSVPSYRSACIDQKYIHIRDWRLEEARRAAAIRSDEDRRAETTRRDAARTRYAETRRAEKDKP